MPKASARQIETIVRVLEDYYGAVSNDGVAEEPLETLIRTILSQNTTDSNSHRAFQQLRRTFPTWQACLAADRRKIGGSIRTAGLWQVKAGYIKQVLAAVTLGAGSSEPPAGRGS